MFYYIRIILIIHCLTSDSDPYWAHTDYSLFIYREKTLWSISPPFRTCLLSAYELPIVLYYLTVGIYGQRLRGHVSPTTPTCSPLPSRIGRCLAAATNPQYWHRTATYYRQTDSAAMPAIMILIAPIRLRSTDRMIVPICLRSTDRLIDKLYA